MFEEYGGLGGFSVYPKWRGAPLVPSDSADCELARLNMDLQDVKTVLEEGIETRERRAEGVIEKTLARKDCSVKVVVVESFSRALKEPCWLIAHVGTVKR
jgi:hypothetical protein